MTRAKTIRLTIFFGDPEGAGLKVARSCQGAGQGMRRITRHMQAGRVASLARSRETRLCQRRVFYRRTKAFRHRNDLQHFFFGEIKQAGILFQPKRKNGFRSLRPKAEARNKSADAFWRLMNGGGNANSHLVGIWRLTGRDK